MKTSIIYTQINKLCQILIRFITPIGARQIYYDVVKTSGVALVQELACFYNVFSGNSNTLLCFTNILFIFTHQSLVNEDAII